VLHERYSGCRKTAQGCSAIANEAQPPETGVYRAAEEISHCFQKS
jgi:hypothetical protein